MRRIVTLLIFISLILALFFYLFIPNFYSSGQFTDSDYEKALKLQKAQREMLRKMELAADKNLDSEGNPICDEFDSVEDCEMRKHEAQ